MEAHDHARVCTDTIRLKFLSLVERPCPLTQAGCEITRLFFRRALDENFRRSSKTIDELNVQVRALTIELGIAKTHIAKFRNPQPAVTDESRFLSYYELYGEHGEYPSSESSADDYAIYGSPSPDSFEQMLLAEMTGSATAATSGSDSEAVKIDLV